MLLLLLTADVHRCLKMSTAVHHCVQKNSKKCDVSVLKSMIEYC